MVLLINGVLISYFCRMNEIDDQTIFSIYCIILKQIKGCAGQFKSDYKGCLDCLYQSSYTGCLHRKRLRNTVLRSVSVQCCKNTVKRRNGKR